MTMSAAQSKTQLADLNITYPLASIVHQTDRNGKQQPILNGFRRKSREASRAKEMQQRGSLRHIFGSVLSKFSLSEQQEDQQKAKQGRPLTSKIQTVGTTIQLRPSLLPPVSFVDADKKCLVLDLDETLVHSSFRPTNNYDFIIPVEIDGSTHLVYVCKRPGAEEFLIEMAKYYEIVVYTASLSVYADPLLDKLDPEGTIRYRLYREHCVQYEGCYVKDLSLLDRDITQTIIVDNSPMAYAFHPRNAIGCSSFYDDLNDRELQSIGRFLTKFQDVEDVRNHGMPTIDIQSIFPVQFHLVR
ncbi:nuclear LIM factor interactor-interacting protein cleavage-specific form, putative [Phytophthora infestans T30-4]|uniref:Nuclear LIM factor interactor-interacting protein cleavage-specific form, putative n=1 Tax=Phytophthora infestans (strain T30-4) TaxID=403677 RepID=D0NGI7_PHYIT|nr:nuclear LIM factor interactor-interacting protein cleavage-specific form, putative [Phytophthora infestans T30-4]EEY57388.1 nuclear LIM factor interactor-interacting protein cleavage-specific form, putative [Phytophthora infestans T30-4]|eukprot:XP_002901998.1 nuclear LIM factor interactor-interacting protein cleavage-specific form, putative [Phytophthora infestans T30-4]